MKKISKMTLCFVLTLEKHLQSNQYPDLVFEIHHIRTKYVYFLFRLNFDFGFFIKPWRNRLCIWTISQERMDLDCNLWGSLLFKITTVGEVWWPLVMYIPSYSWLSTCVCLFLVSPVAIFGTGFSFVECCSGSFRPFLQSDCWKLCNWFWHEFSGSFFAVIGRGALCIRRSLVNTWLPD